MLNRDGVAYQSTAAATGGINPPGAASTDFQIETSISLSARREHSQLKRNIVYIFIAICPKIIELALCYKAKDTYTLTGRLV